MRYKHIHAIKGAILRIDGVVDREMATRLNNRPIRSDTRIQPVNSILGPSVGGGWLLITGTAHSHRSGNPVHLLPSRFCRDTRDFPPLHRGNGSENWSASGLYIARFRVLKGLGSGGDGDGAALTSNPLPLAPVHPLPFSSLRNRTAWNQPERRCWPPRQM